MKQTLVLGGPGAGKTTRLLGVMEAALERGIHPSKVAFVAFTNAAADEARNRARARFGLTDEDLPLFRTIHSLCFREMGLRRSDVLGESGLGEFAEICGELRDDEDTDGPATRLSASHLLTLDHYARTTRLTIRQAWEDHGASVDWFRLLRFSEAYKVYKRDRGLIDFTDMLDQYARTGAPTSATVAIVDEAQDLTKLQWRCVDIAFRKADELWIGGDDLQCQPGWTLVETTGGLRRLDKLNPQSDRLLAYSRVDAMVYGKRNGGYKFKKSVRPYTGDLYTIKTDQRATQCTYNHKWFVKWSVTAEMRATTYVVYLMKKGDWFRVGWTKMFTRVNFHVNMRANNERADAVWILRTFHNKSDAYEYEQIISSRYGIPMLPFYPVRGLKDVTDALIKRVFDSVDSMSGALRAIIDHGLSIQHPFINRLKANYSRYGGAINEVAACNLIPSMMLVPVYTGNKTPQWVPFTTVKNPVIDLLVYSLDVEKYHTYIADKIVTHNSIHRWAGADEDHFLGLPYDREILPLSHRLSKAVFEVAEGIAARVQRKHVKEWRPSDRPGSVSWLASPEEADLGAGSWLLLARTRTQLKELSDEARNQGVVYSLKGQSSVNADDVAAIKAWEALRAGRPIGAGEAYTALHAAGRPVPKGLEEDQLYGAGDLGLKDLPIWHDALTRITLDDREYYLACLRRNQSLTAAPKVRVDTIHGSKGMEAEHVLLLTDLTGRVQKGFELDADAEHRVFYVGVTRASQELVIVPPRKAGGYII